MRPPQPREVLRQLFSLPPGYSKFLGDIVAQWSLIEHLLSHCTYALLRLSPKEGRIAVRESRAAELFLVVQQLAELRGITLPVDCAALMTDLREAQRQRNFTRAFGVVSARRNRSGLSHAHRRKLDTKGAKGEHPRANGAGSCPVGADRFSRAASTDHVDRRTGG